MPECNYCKESFSDFKSLAIHINSSHPHKHNKWAANFVLQDVLFEKADKNENRVPLTEEEKAAKKSTQRELSGVEKTVLTICPQCKGVEPMRIPVEFLTSEQAWKNDDNRPFVTCSGCRR